MKFVYLVRDDHYFFRCEPSIVREVIEGHGVEEEGKEALKALLSPPNSGSSRPRWTIGNDRYTQYNEYDFYLLQRSHLGRYKNVFFEFSYCPNSDWPKMREVEMRYQDWEALKRNHTC